jgi:DNA-binding NtrC family response regulator
MAKKNLLADLPDDCVPLVKPDGSLRSLEEVEAAAIDYALIACGSSSAAADMLGIGRSTLYRKMRELGLQPKRGRGRPPTQSANGSRQRV